MSEYELIHAALQYVARNRIPGVDIFACASSDPYFGLKPQHHFDRLNVAFKFQGDQVEIQCQILFDSSDYAFVPDIIVDPEWHQLADPELFPIEWPIHEEDCIHRWLTSLWSTFNHKIFGDELEEEEEHDELESSCQSSVVHAQTPSILPVTELTSAVENLMDPAISNAQYDTPSFGLSDQEDECTMDVEVRSPIERRAFIEQWISTMPNHVIRFDADQYESIALYMTVKIPDAIWHEMKVYQRKSLSELNSEGRGRGTIGKPKDSAPAIVHLQMDKNFPDTPLSVLVISAINTDQEKRDEAEQMQFEMTMSPNWTLEDMCRRVQETLVEEIPKFHSGLFTNLST